MAARNRTVAPASFEVRRTGRMHVDNLKGAADIEHDHMRDETDLHRAARMVKRRVVGEFRHAPRAEIRSRHRVDDFSARFFDSRRRRTDPAEFVTQPMQPLARLQRAHQLRAIHRELSAVRGRRLQCREAEARLRSGLRRHSGDVGIAGA
ncbi:hypothetical protein C0Z16_30295 [Paraburkholderia rhynchosiae]|uniref:Uncharacterized protein n=1 Tax=Paraburkholderia rhynchosiae TaxID=487049 RepID=A0ABX4UZ78_9BURK|nr:hypothetical protein C0Z16_30295 [Paraburkholderia rhynchosiae]